MTYVIGAPCVDVMDKSRVDVCPVDCIYLGGRIMYIHADECVDCGACEPVCPVDAIPTRRNCLTAGTSTGRPAWKFSTRSDPRAAPVGWARR
jgi:NAD-dependent dihydropyrimidine dehydrogenase PreA subunit